MSKSGLSAAIALGLCFCVSAVHAVPAIPEASGWSGHVNLAVGAGGSESNMLASLGSVDLGDDRISSLDEDAGSEDLVMPIVQFEVAYTLGDSATQFYLGNQVADYLNFDLETTLETHLGIRQAIPDIGAVDFSLATTPLATDVWKDPYLVDQRRGDTERTSTGVKISWDDILSTPFEFEWVGKEIELDDEESGTSSSLGLSRAQQRQLRRTGDVDRFTLHYDWQINERHRLVPGIGYTDYQLDGDAMAEDGFALHLKHLYDLGRWRLVTKLSYEDVESDEINPIYDDERQMESLGASVTVFYSNPFGLKRWTANASAAYTDEDSNIDFYDANLGLVSFGMFYRFD